MSAISNLFTAISSLAILISIPTARAEEAGDFKYLIEENAVTIKKYRGGEQTVNIPNQIVGLPVRTIGVSAFASVKSISKVIIPNGITKIDSTAFVNCPNLLSVTIPASVISISDGEFGGCKSLTRIDVDKANPAYSSRGGILFDKKGTKLIRYPAATKGSDYVIPEGVADLGKGAFSDCTGLTSITIPASITTIRTQQFSSCKNLAEVTLTSGLSIIQSFAFGGCTNLVSITLPASVTSIQGMAFNGCTSLTTVMFEGDAPPDSKKYPTAFKNTAPNFKIHYYKGSAGFTVPNWNGYKAVEIDPVTTFHSWLSPDGRTIKAKFLKLSGESVMVQKEDNQQVTIPIDKLAPASVGLARRLATLVSSEVNSK